MVNVKIIDNSPDWIVNKVIHKYTTRSAEGMKKYGVTMAENPLSLREWLNHLQQELMDATLYAERAMGNSEWVDNVAEFNTAIEVQPSFDYGDLICEEYDEWIKAEDGSENELKECVDLIYVLISHCLQNGWDVNEAFRRVHASNMTKFDDNGKPVRNETGKVIKGKNYVPADLGDLV